ncbi:ElyC/SanA/YdcF family protein [Ectothiorhodospira variabilis]|uniref:ElyC/SanA/YdcF family protein n=1 Tax=Ectothiorhodospira variabilis TaxID=505694 RepID=UPI001EFA6426|nr:ElyC/SanA/YdcF family protein [Ectothiorhodospira variabilis]MCG5497806.1 YdcF family protein [Ectothiorhodospira variabilis]
MLDTLKPLTAALIMPLPLAASLTLLGVLAWWIGRRCIARTLVITAILGLLLASWGPVSEGLLSPLESRHPPLSDTASLEGVTAVVVLGGGWNPDGPGPASMRLSESSAQRLLEGVRLVQALPQARLLVSGASRDPDREPVAAGYSQAAAELGVTASRVVMLDTPVDTAQEAYAVREVLAPGERFVLVTSASHMPRAVLHFQRAGLEPIPAPTRFKTGDRSGSPLRFWLPSAQHLRKTERALYEYMGLMALELDH